MTTFVLWQEQSNQSRLTSANGTALIFQPLKKFYRTAMKKNLVYKTLSDTMLMLPADLW